MHRWAFPFIPVLTVLIFVLSACNRHQEQANAGRAPTQASVPTNPNDASAWETYMVQVSKPHADGMGRPYLFLVPSGDVPAARDRRQQIQQAMTDMVSRNRFPGNTIAVGGPNPGITADVLVAAFGAAKPGSLKSTTVLYVGDDTDKPRVEKSIAAAGAAFRYAKM